MGLADRDYMRERRRAESKAARAAGGGWYRPSPRIVSHPWQKWVFLLSAVSILIPMYGEAQRKGWLPDFTVSLPFPETGSVTVARTIERSSIKSTLTVDASAANAVVQLFDPATNRHIFSVYVAGNNRITVPAPTGTFRMRLIEGKKWHGTTRYFGPNTSYETVAELMTFEPRSGHIIDLHRKPDGNLKTRLMLSQPEKL
ncbi:hypothetical protein PX554_20890 [Sphingomonas sp. H39-1-10]|uniref:hypothetical protein n=1 Tax=Sphingomonas pollutisoli TaxID=3030829 RepID=UPI0023B99714|nr:hypothetical protein [Sphingomonas pollutisoli]MDF0490593.1 hypothetical protein [Sphingomonas pollutisoli]